MLSSFQQNLDEWSFDIFALNEESDGHALKCTAYELFTRYDLIAKFKVSMSPALTLHSKKCLVHYSQEATLLPGLNAVIFTHSPRL